MSIIRPVIIVQSTEYVSIEEGGEKKVIRKNNRRDARHSFKNELANNADAFDRLIMS